MRQCACGGALLAGLVLLSPFPAQAAKGAHVPAWVRQAAATPSPRLRPHDKAVVLLDQTGITVDVQGRATVHRREAIRLLTAAGRSYAAYRLFYEQGSRVRFLHSWTLGADEHEYQLDDRDVADVSAVPDFAVFDSTRVRVAQAEAAEPGAVVAFESEYQEAPYTTSWDYDIDQEIPVAARTITLTLPPGFRYYEGWAHMEPVKPVSLGPSQWQWQIAARASLDDEVAAPELGEVAGRMLLAYSGGPVHPVDGNWSTVGDWYSDLARGRDASSPEIAAKVAALTAGKPAFTDKLLAITGFMQDEIRYVAVEMGIGGWQPHPATAVFHNRYGDCKDKATLLVAMLAQAGITAHPLMVDFDHRIDPGMPTHYADHMIVVIEIPPEVHDPALEAVVEAGGKRLLVFDPTNSVSPAGSLEPELQGSYGLMLAGSASTLLQLPVLTPKDNLLVRTGAFTLAVDGSLSGDLSEMRQGNTGDILRHLYLQGDMQKLEEREARNLDSTLSNATLSGLHAERVHERSVPLEVHFHVASSGYARHAGALLLVRPAVLGLYEPSIGDPSKPRLYPIVLAPEETVRERYTIQLPAHYTADDLPDPVHIETPFATFQSAVTLEGDALHYSREITFLRLQISASEFLAYRDFIGKVASAERSEAVLKPAS